MKFDISVCNIFYSGVSDLGIFILDDLPTHKYPKEYVSFEFNLLSCELLI